MLLATQPRRYLFIIFFLRFSGEWRQTRGERGARVTRDGRGTRLASCLPLHSPENAKQNKKYSLRNHFILIQGLAGFFTSDEGPVEEGYDDTKPDGSHPAIMG